MRTSIYSSAATRLSSRFRLLANTLSKKTYPNLLGIEYQSQDPLERVANSSFPLLLKRVGGRLRRDEYLLSKKALSASDELAVVLMALRECLEDRSFLKLGREEIHTLCEELDVIETMLKALLSDDEGTLLYREIRKKWIARSVFLMDAVDAATRAGIAFNTYPQKLASGIQMFVANVLHAADIDLPRMCHICSRIASKSKKYCQIHAPTQLDKRGYARGQLILERMVTANSPKKLISASTNFVHRQWHREVGIMFDTVTAGSKDWKRIFISEMRAMFGKQWRSELAKVSTLFSQGLQKADAATILVKAIDASDEYAITHPIYFARKVKELHTYATVDATVRRRNAVNYDQVIEAIAKHGGSTKRAAAELNISQRLVQLMLKKARDPEIFERKGSK